MFKEGLLDKILAVIRKLIPRRIFVFFQPMYHWLLAYAGAVFYGFPSNKLKVIGITGTKGKSTTVYLLSNIFEEAGEPVAAIGSLGYKIKEREWPNTLKMTMPGRFRLQKFLKQALMADVKYAILEVTSEGISQKRHLGVKFDCAVLTNIHPEHIESHGSFEKYIEAKKQLFKKASNIHVLNADEPMAKEFKNIPSNKKVFYSIKDWNDWDMPQVTTEFIKYNMLAAEAVAREYGISRECITAALKKIDVIPGRMEFINEGQLFKVVVDYAHTPDSLEKVYSTLKVQLADGGKLICVLGAAGGGRDKWKRPKFGEIASKYCDEIILTNEDPYDENPEEIISQIASGIEGHDFARVVDRAEAIKKALTGAYKNDIVVITGKGSETTMAIARGKKIPWSDGELVRGFLNNL